MTTTISHKRCSYCEIDLPIDWFPRRQMRGKLVHIGKCRSCEKAYNRIYMAQNDHKEYNRWYQRTYALRTKYGLTSEDVDALLAEQGGRCAICRTTEPKSRHGMLAIDHCHSSGKVRGMLCDLCNKGLGSFGDDPDRMELAIAYLRKHAP